MENKSFEDKALMMEIDALPDELLLQIFAHVADADTLLDGVARTCKRWLRVSRDPAAWANVRVEVRAEPDQSRSTHIRSAARALLHAPALRAIVLDYEFLTDKEIDLVTSALSRCRAAQVREVNLVKDTFPELTRRRVSRQQPAPLHALTRLLWRHRDCLRALHVKTHWYWKQDLGVTEDGSPISFLELLAALRHLEELRLVLFGETLVGKYAGELRDRLPRLRVLGFKVQFWPGLAKHCTALAGDLLRGAASSLRAVDLWLCRLALESEVMAALLPACTGLRDLHCNVVVVPLVRGLTHLRRLHLAFENLQMTTDAQLRECLLAVEGDCGEALAGVRVLQLDDYMLSGSDEEFRRMLLVGELFAAVARRAPLAEDVSVHMGVFYWEKAEEYVPLSHYFRFGRAADSLLSPACLPSVRRLRLYTCLPADVDRVAALPDSLTEVVVEVFESRLQRDTAAAPFEEAVARLKASRPDLKVDLNITTYPPEIYPLF